MKKQSDVKRAALHLKELLSAAGECPKTSDIEQLQNFLTHPPPWISTLRASQLAAHLIDVGLPSGLEPATRRAVQTAFWSFVGQVLLQAVENNAENPEKEESEADDPRDLPPPTIYGEEVDLDSDILMIWVNAFIPGSAPFSATVPTGPYAGQKMIPGPFALSPWPFSMLPGSDCFMTDNREFSNLRRASSRMHSLAVFDLSSSPIRWDHHHRCDLSVEVDCEQGDEEGRAYANRDSMKYLDFQEKAAKNFVVKLDAHAFDPLFGPPASLFVPYIDIELTFKWFNDSKVLMWEGTVDRYPAFEAYAQLRRAKPTPLFKLQPPGGSSPTDLYNHTGHLRGVGDFKEVG